jgi:UDP-N-acetylmuramyl-tripeptide synthetase
MERYRDAKARLFKELLAPGGRAILNLDDPASGAMRPADRPVWTYGLSEGDFHATGLVGAPHGSVFVARTPEGEVPVRLPMPGRHNVSNALLALALAASLGVDLSSAARGLAAAPQVPGRFERVPDARGFDVLVDFAHTPDALAHALRSLREVTPGRLLLLFGCGGDRDRGKRPEMGRIAADLADLVVVTSDNPRGEDPEAILDAILAGMGGARARVMRDVDRGRAIHTILAEAREGDVVLLAGKGHEDTQEIAGRFLPFDDRSVAAEALLTLRPRAPEGAHP